MKTLTAFGLALLTSWECSAQTSLYEGSTGILDIPCLTLYNNGAPVLDTGGKAITYKAQMKATSSTQFTLTSAAVATSVDECPGRYDSATGVYTDLVTWLDNAYTATMTKNADLSFTLNAGILAGPAKTSLWVVSNGTNTLYLGGTVRAARVVDYPVPRAFDEAYAKSSALYFELDLDDPVESGASLTPAQAFAFAVDPQGKTLNQVLTPDTYTALTTYLAGKSIAIANVNTWSAQMVMNTLTFDDVRQQAAATQKGIDSHFADKAKLDQKPVFGLETFASQITMLQSVNEGLEDAVVSSTLEELANGKAAANLVDILKTWRRGDIAAIQGFSDKVRTENREDYDRVQTNRNNAWLPQIEALLATPETEMVLVGSAHVAGPEGLVTLLKSRGYTVRKY